MQDCLLHDLHEFGLAVGFLFRFRIRRRNLHPRFTRQDFHGLHERHVLGFTNECDRVAACVAAKAVINPLPVIHVK